MFNEMIDPILKALGPVIAGMPAQSLELWVPLVALVTVACLVMRALVTRRVREAVAVASEFSRLAEATEEKSFQAAIKWALESACPSGNEKAKAKKKEKAFSWENWAARCLSMVESHRDLTPGSFADHASAACPPLSPSSNASVIIDGLPRVVLLSGFLAALVGMLHAYGSFDVSAASNTTVLRQALVELRAGVNSASTLALVVALCSLLVGVGTALFTPKALRESAREELARGFSHLRERFSEKPATASSARPSAYQSPMPAPKAETKAPSPAPTPKVEAPAPSPAAKVEMKAPSPVPAPKIETKAPSPVPAPKIETKAPSPVPAPKNETKAPSPIPAPKAETKAPAPLAVPVAEVEAEEDQPTGSWNVPPVLAPEKPAVSLTPVPARPAVPAPELAKPEDEKRTDLKLVAPAIPVPSLVEVPELVDEPLPFLDEDLAQDSVEQERDRALEKAAGSPAPVTNFTATEPPKVEHTRVPSGTLEMSLDEVTKFEQVKPQATKPPEPKLASPKIELEIAEVEIAEGELEEALKLEDVKSEDSSDPESTFSGLVLEESGRDSHDPAELEVELGAELDESEVTNVSAPLAPPPAAPAENLWATPAPKPAPAAPTPASSTPPASEPASEPVSEEPELLFASLDEDPSATSESFEAIMRSVEIEESGVSPSAPAAGTPLADEGGVIALDENDDMPLLTPDMAPISDGEFPVLDVLPVDAMPPLEPAPTPAGEWDDGRRLSESEEKIAALNAQIAGLDAGIEKAYQDRLAGRISEEMFNEKHRKWKEAKDELEKRIQALKHGESQAA